MKSEEKQRIPQEKTPISQETKRQETEKTHDIYMESLSAKAEWSHLAKIGITIFLTFGCCILLFFMILRYQQFAGFWKKAIHAAQPITIGLVLAYLMNPIMHGVEEVLYPFIEKRQKDKEKAKAQARGIAIISSVFSLLLIIGLLIAAVVPSVISSVSGLINALPGYVDSAIKMIQNGILGDSDIAHYASVFLKDAVDTLEDWAQNTLMPQAQKYIAQITSGMISVLKTILNFVIGIIVMVYVMAIQEKLKGQSKKTIYAIFSPRQGNLIIEVIRKASEIFGGFITGKIVDSAIIGVICYIGCLILRIPDPILIAVIIGVTNIVPVFGPFIGAVPSILLVVIQSPIHAVYLLIFIVVLQQVDGNIIGPKILGSSTGLSSFWVMCAILIGGGMCGFFGMLLGVPVFAVIYYIIQLILKHTMIKRRLPVGTQDYINLIRIDEKSNRMIYSKETKEEKK